LEEACLLEAHLEGAYLLGAHLKKAVLQGAHLEGAALTSAHLEETNLWEAHLEGAFFRDAHLEEARFRESNLEGTDFSTAILDKTIFKNCTIDKNTDFSGSNIDNAIIDPGLHTALKCNIRRKTWGKWYEGKPCYKTFFVQLFWRLTDYGSGLKNFTYLALGALLTFTAIYGVIDCQANDVLTQISPPSECSVIGLLAWFLQILCFTVSTMVTLGFAGINVKIIEASLGWSIFATIAVTLNLLIGYFLLAVLVTRIGIMSQSLAPEQDYSEEYKPKKPV
jgi:hypothetical protein